MNDTSTMPSLPLPREAWRAPIGRVGRLAAVTLMPLTLLVAGFADPVYASPTAEIEADAPVDAVDVPLRDVAWEDPSAHQVWQPPTAVMPLHEMIEVEATNPAGAVEIHLLDDEAATAAGIPGVVVEIDADAAEGGLELVVDYGKANEAFGSGWSDRLELFRLPSCALDTPEQAECLELAPVATDRSTAEDRFIAAIDDQALDAEAEPFGAGAGSSEPMLFAVTATAASGGDTGDFSATKLDPTGSWSAGSNTGAFSYAVPIDLPPAAGPIPELGLSYNSAVHDGRTSGRNNQASWIGDGWGFEPGFIERAYTACSADTGSGSNNSDATLTGDTCWDGSSNHITVSLDGVNGTLLKDDDSGNWYVDAGANWKIEKLGQPASPTTATSEQWKITTDDGTQYFFGSETAAASRWTMPVFGNHSGEPCRVSAFKDSSCVQAYRWMLDKTVDVNGNMVRYYYTTQTGHYGAAGDPTKRTAFTREGRLLRIEYGLRSNDTSVQPTARVVFTTADRCEANCYDSNGKPRANSWPDVPWDLHCDAAPCTTQLTPVFFETKKLTTITTQVRNGSAWRDVTEWKLEHEFKDYGDEDQAVLWLKSIQQIGKAASPSITLPKMEFGGIAMPNRVDVGQGIPQIWRWRLTSIKTETGAVITVNYSDPDCTTANLPANKSANAMRCYPVKWTPPTFSDPEEDWFHKYVVDSIIEQETTTESAAVYTYYNYSTSGGGTSALWAWDDSAFTEKKDRTYNQWRGYPQVTTRLGDPDAGPQQVTRARFYRGMNGQPLPGGGTRSVSLTDAENNTVTDHKALIGGVFEELTYNGTQIIEGTTTRYWTHKRAAQSHEGGAYESWVTAPSREDKRRHLTGSSWQRTRASTSYDNLGRPTTVTDHGDLAITGDETCTRTYYTDNPTAHIYSTVRAEETVAVDCDTTPQRPRDVLNASRHYYDGATSNTAQPIKGQLTRTDVLDIWPESGTAAYATVSRTGYDALGRVNTVTDAVGTVTTTTFTPSGAGPVTQTTTTNGLGHTETTHYDPAFGAPTKIIDPNGRITEAELDALGRNLGVWRPGRDRAAGKSATTRYEYRIRNNGPSTVTTTRLNAGGSYSTEIELYDSLLRPRQTQTQTTGGARLLTEIRYDSAGRVEETRGPDFNLGAPSTTFAWVERGASEDRVEFRFDAAGRTTAEIQYQGHDELWRTTTTFGGSSAGYMVTLRPPAGAPAQATLENAIGQTIQARTWRSNTPSGTYDTLTYTYTPLGSLATMTDAAGNQWSWRYDRRGRQTSMTDPDAGTVTTTYDNADNIRSTTDARGETLTYTYDAIGRRTARHDGNGTLLAAWTYDTVALGKGLPATATRYVEGHAYTERIWRYDAGGRATATSITIPAVEGALAGTYTTGQSYYDNGMLAGHSHGTAGSMPGQVIDYGYDEIGNPTWAIATTTTTNDTTVIVDDATYTPFGEIQTRRLNSTFDKHAYQGFQYETTTRRLQRFTFDHETNAPAVADVAYTYDTVGNILSIADTPTGATSRWHTQCFNYDAQRRLTEAWTQAGDGACAATIANAEIGGPAMYGNTYAYNAAGNRVSDTIQVPGQTVAARTFNYPSAGGSLPHAPTSVALDNGTQVVFGYDAAGNTISRDVNGNLEIYQWDAEGNNTRVINGDDETRMVYGPDGGRRIRDDGDTATLFLPGTEIVWNKTLGTKETTRYFEHAGQVVASAQGTSLSQWRFTITNQQGTATHSVNADAHSNVTVRYTDPFGLPRGEWTGQWHGQRSFVGGVSDPSGLIQIGERSYDPLFGRFMSVDPIIDSTDAQQINGYAYANHSPVTFSDSTGMWIGWDDVKNAGKAVGSAVSSGATKAWEATSNFAVDVWNGKYNAEIGGFMVGALIVGACVGAGIATIGLAMVACASVAGAGMLATTTAWNGGSAEEIGMAAVEGAAWGALFGMGGMWWAGRAAAAPYVAPAAATTRGGTAAATSSKNSPKGTSSNKTTTSGAGGSTAVTNAMNRAAIRSNALKYALSPQKIKHIIEPSKHGFSRIVRITGGRSQAMRAIVNSLFSRNDLPKAGKFSVDRWIHGELVRIRGFVDPNGVPKIGTAFIPAKYKK